MIGMDGAFLMSSVFGLNARPHTAIVFPFVTHRASSIFWTNSSCACLLILCTSLSNPKLYPSSSAIVSNAETSLGKQLPPHPMPAFRNALPIRLSIPMPSVTWSMLAPESSHMRATAFVKEIFIARNELLACLMSSALFTSVTITGAFIGAYSSFMNFSARLFSTPITILSGLRKSCIAVPSLKNSGLLTISKSMFRLLYCLIVFPTLSPVFTGTVLLSMTILYASAVSAISRAAPATYERSAFPLASGGVLTAIKIASDF